MNEDQAIDRIREALRRELPSLEVTIGPSRLKAACEAAWNEMKAIARREKLQREAAQYDSKRLMAIEQRMIRDEQPPRWVQHRPELEVVTTIDARGLIGNAHANPE